MTTRYPPRVGFLISLPALLVLVLLAVPSAALAAHTCRNAELEPTTDNLDQVRKATHCLINVERKRLGLKSVRASEQLRRGATRYSLQMVDSRFFTHVSPMGSTLRNRVRRGTSYLRGSRSWSLGENIAWGSGKRATPRYVVDSWMRSRTHRPQIVNRGYRHLGVGIAIGSPKGSNGRPAATFTADFGRRR